MMQDFTFFGTRTICIRAVPKFFCSVNGPLFLRLAKSIVKFRTRLNFTPYGNPDLLLFFLQWWAGGGDVFNCCPVAELHCTLGAL